MTQLELVDGIARGAAFRDAVAGRPVTVVGLGRETSAAARLLHGAGAHVRVEPMHTRADMTADALVIVTVAGALTAPGVVAARSAGVPVLGDLDLGWCATEAQTFAIAGGASAGATLRLAATIVAAHGRPVLAVGGGAAASVAERFAGDGVLLVEPSDEQLATVQLFRPRVAVVLSGAGAAAARLFAHQTARDCLVLAAADPAAPALAHAARSRVVWLSAVHAVDHGVYVARGRIAARLNGYVEEICPAPGIPAPQLEPALAAVACALWAGLDPDTIGEALSRRFALSQRPRYVPAHGSMMAMLTTPAEAVAL